MRERVLVLSVAMLAALSPAMYALGHRNGYVDAMEENAAWERTWAADNGTRTLLGLCRWWNERVEQALETRFNGGR